MTSCKHRLEMDVLIAARGRISLMFDECRNIYVSFSGGKDSTVLLHLVVEEALKRDRKVGVFFVDLEGQYKLTIDHILECLNLYSGIIIPYWVALPITLRNAVSMYMPTWICWERGREFDWIRQPPSNAIIDEKYFPFYRYAMDFGDMVLDFGEWFSQQESTACFVGLRTDESLNRFRTIASKYKECLDGIKWTTKSSEHVFNAYPLYDWRTEDIWAYFGKSGKPYNKLYDLMHRAGLSIHQMRTCQPYGDDQRKGLWLFQIIEPETWGKVVARVNGANSGALYAQESGNILGNIKITKPEGHTWESFAKLLLGSLPPKTQEHYKAKIGVFIKWWMEHGYPDGPVDSGDVKQEANRELPSWKRICKALLRNDYWCRGLSFAPQGPDTYQRYIERQKENRRQWGLTF